MKRRELIRNSALLGLLGTALRATTARAAPERAVSAPSNPPNMLKRPAQGGIPVAFLVSDGAVVIDFCGPWEVFQDVMVGSGADHHPFRLYTVAETKAPIRASGGLRIVPDYDFATAPAPKVLVIPAQGGRSEAALEWIRASTKATDVTMSVCTGASLLARTGLLSGRSATTHHDGYKVFAMEFPDVRLRRGVRFVEDGNLASSGGLSSGIDLALHVVERYFGRDVASKAAHDMEYQGRGWLDPASNAEFATAAVSTDQRPLCPVCTMEVDKATSPRSTYQGKTYWFCMPSHKELFDKSPPRFLE